MTGLFVAFITGLTTGGLSCLAMQGGLLASSLAFQIEQDLHSASTESERARPRLARPILLFLAAKLIAYTILGFLLGMLGSVLQLTPNTRAILFITIGVFMVGNALRMFNVHPLFRYFTFEPPSIVTRYIRRRAKSGVTWVTPIFLGLLTVLIPCGVTQAMMAVALGSGSPLFGAAIMASFTLGTMPVFFSLAYFAARLGSRMEKAFTRAVAIVLLVLGLFSIDSGLNLMGSPYYFSNLKRSLLAAEVSAQASLAAAQPALAAAPTPTPANVTNSGADFGVACACKMDGLRFQQPGVEGKATPPLLSTLAAENSEAARVTLYARNDGYEPAFLSASANTPLLLNIVTDNTVSCSRAFVIPALNVEVLLPISGTMPIDIPPQKPASVLRFSCSMGMYTGQISFQ